MNRVMKVAAGLILVLTVILALYIMVNHMGLIDGLDFGAGAYYYADIPNFDKYTDSGAYKSPVPMWAIVALFLLWGAAMYKFLVYVDGIGGKR